MNNVDLVAFYLPQYHRIAENDAWWGEGFTEWTNVKKAVPNFNGHKQPLIPGPLGYYDLMKPSVQVEQAKLAKTYGIKGFCYYVYWFGGRRLLEKPLDAMLGNKDVEAEFCVCWANENWTRRWDGNDKDILVDQPHTVENDQRFIHDMLKYIGDERYIRVNGRPLLLVYRADLLKDPKGAVQYWKKVVSEAGLGELYACAVEFYGVEDHASLGFDALVEFPPHKSLLEENLLAPIPEFTNSNYTGTVFDYRLVKDWFLSKEIPSDQVRFRGVMPSWDNTARRQDTGHIFHNSDPISYQSWLFLAGLHTMLTHPPGRRLVFINAWNEWGEGCILEPDARLGHMNLQATRAALMQLNDRAAVFDDFQNDLAENGVDGARRLILMYERSIAEMLKHSPPPDFSQLADRTPFRSLSKIYLNRVKRIARQRIQKLVG